MVTPTKVLKKWSLFEGDKVIWMILFFLGMISIIEVYSASSNMSYKTGYYWTPILQHASYFVVGVLATILVHKIPCRYFKLIPLAGIPLSVFLLGIAMFTTKVNNASRWLEVGGIGFQPSEIAKGVLIATTAMILSSMRDEAGAQRRAFKWIMGVSVVICLLIVPENFSTAAMTFLVILVMMFIGGIPWKQLGTLLGIIVIAGASLFSFLRFAPDSTIESMSDWPGLHRLPTWASRVRGHGNIPENAADYDLTKNPQVTHAKIAIATCNRPGAGEFRGTRFPATVVFRLHLCHRHRGTRIGRWCLRHVPVYRVAFPVGQDSQPVRAKLPGFPCDGAIADARHASHD